MQELGDIELLREYARSGSEDAFATLISRHINLVYAAAMRQTRNPHQAEEITQAVFTILAKKAGALEKATILSGWLFQTTRLTAANLRRGEFRRARREQEAYMQSTGNDAEADVWQHIAPLLDAAIANLGEKDRNAVVMRYIQGKDLREVGAALGATEAAAQKRVNRAVERLRAFFGKRGVMLTGAVFASTLAANSTIAAPAELATIVKTVAVTRGVAAGASTVALIKETLKTMAWTKLNLAAGLGVAALLLASSGVAVVRTTRPEPDGFSAAEIGKKAREKYDSISSYRETGSVVSETDGITGGTATFTVRFGRPNYYRIEWEQKMDPHTPNRGAVWSAGDGAFIFIGGQRFARTSKMEDDQKALASGAGLSGSANTIPATLLKLSHGDALAAFTRNQDMVRDKDEKIGGVDCYVITYDSTPPKLPMKGKISGTITLWIGKADFLIRRQRFTTDGVINLLPNGQLPVVEAHKVVTTETHENIVLDEAMTPADFKFDAPPNTKAFETRAN